MSKSSPNFCSKISIHALREEGDQVFVTQLARGRDFNPRPPRGGRRPVRLPDAGPDQISIHALREEGDFFIPSLVSGRQNFNPRPPRGGRLPAQGAVTVIILFQSTPSARRATYMALKANGGDQFQSTPSARRATYFLDADFFKFLFQSTPSARRATGWRAFSFAIRQISIHALREEGDPPLPPLAKPPTNFNPRPPRGGRPRYFSSSIRQLYFNPRPPRGGRPLFQPIVFDARDFNPRPPRGGRQQKQRKNPPLLFHYTHLCTI